MTRAINGAVEVKNRLKYWLWPGSKPSKEGSKKGKPDRKVGYLKMKVMEDLKASSINETIKKDVKAGTSAQDTTNLKRYWQTMPLLSNRTKRKPPSCFPWANRTISNAKKVLLCNHHNGINNNFVQNYLDEFCYKFNRRYFGDKLFDRLVVAALGTTWY